MLIALFFTVAIWYGIPAGLLAGVRCARSNRPCNWSATSLIFRTFVGMLVCVWTVIALAVVGFKLTAASDFFVDLFKFALATIALGLVVVSPYLGCMYLGYFATRGVRRVVQRTEATGEKT